VNEIDFNSETWRAVRDYVEDRLAVRRSALESIGLDSAETEAIRGAIEELKELQQLDNPASVMLIKDELNLMGGV